VAQAYEGRGSRIALGIYNFAGDVGKMAVPAAMAFLIVLVTWRPAVSILGLLGLAAAALIAIRLRSLSGVIENARERPITGSSPEARLWPAAGNRHHRQRCADMLIVRETH
jgi:hypothetical protein